MYIYLYKICQFLGKQVYALSIDFHIFNYFWQIIKMKVDSNSYRLYNDLNTLWLS